MELKESSSLDLRIPLGDTSCLVVGMTNKQQQHQQPLSLSHVDFPSCPWWKLNAKKHRGSHVNSCFTTTKSGSQRLMIIYKINQRNIKGIHGTYFNVTRGSRGC